MAGAAQRDRAPRDASGGHSRSRLGRRAWPVGRHPVRGAVIGGGGTPPRRTRCRRDRARRDRVRALLEWRPDRDGEHVGDRSSRVNHHTGGPAPTACGLQSPPLRHRRRPYLLRAGLNRPLPARGRLRRSHSQRRKAGRAAGAGAYQVRAGHQPQDRQVARPRHTHDGARPRRRGDRVRRREFMTLLGGAAVAWPLAARGQQAGKLPTIGFLGANNATFERTSTDAFVQRLRELGWIENRTVAIEYRWAEGRDERFAEIAAEFIRLKVDVILTYATPSSIAAKKATAVIPIVFAAAGDPVGTGLVASLARPGGNITGLSIQQTDLASKRLEVLREVLPGLRTVAILANIGSPNSVLEMGEAQAAARPLDLAVVTSEVQRTEDIAPAFDALKGRADALYVCSSPLLSTNRIRINSLALGVRLPTMCGLREYTVAGGLMSYGPNISSLFRRAAEYVHKILRGAKPSDLPVEQPTKFDFIITLTTAKILGLEIPPTLLARADEVIE